MKTLILIKDFSRCRMFEITELKDAEYYYLECINEDGFYADRAFLVDDKDALPIADWLEKDQAAIEKAEYERLKKKFEKE